MKEYSIHNRVRVLLNSKARRFKNWVQYGNPRFPEGIAIETATYCNRTCDHCANTSWRDQYTDKQSRMSDDTFKALIERIKEMGWTGTCSYNFFDEPLLNPNLVDMVAYARKNLPRNRFVCYTNGDFLTMEKMGQFVAAGLSEMWISDHNNELLRPSECRPDWHRRIAEIECAYPRHVVYRGVIDYKPWLVNMGGYAHPPTSPRRKRCESVYGWFMVLYNGDVNLCSCEPTRRYIQGNIMDSSILNIWRNSLILDVREGAGQGHAPQLPECVLCLGGNATYAHKVPQKPIGKLNKL
jgi:MoaA/NifB/PqqE/SkfB family radical SAM enzyme